jgi:hypothetical protein
VYYILKDGKFVVTVDSINDVELLIVSGIGDDYVEVVQ